MDPAALERGTSELMDKGLLGFAVVVLGAVVVYLFADGRALRKEITTLAKETAVGLSTSSATIATFTTEISELSRTLQQTLTGVGTVLVHGEQLSRQMSEIGARLDNMLRMIADAGSKK